MDEDSARALITASELAELLGGSDVPVILDVRWQVGQPALYQDYLAGHLPRAQWCDLDTDLAAPPSARGRHPLPEPERLQAALRRWGVHDDSRVVVYDGSTGLAAARAWWVLRWAGLMRVRVLDGGYASWVEAGLPTEQSLDAPVQGTATVRAGSLPTLTAAEAAEWAADGRLVDVRATERFSGATEPIDPVAGHIPGARNLPTTGNVDGTGRFLAPELLRRRLRSVLSGSADPGSAEPGARDPGSAEPGDAVPVGVYCGSGVTAAHTLLAMHEAGLPAVLYPGSWSEWISDPSRPVATGN